MIYLAFREAVPRARASTGSIVSVWLWTLAFSLGHAAPDRAADACFHDHEVTFESNAEGISIAGTLSIPTGPGPHPTVLMITGNGPHTRDQLISGTPMFAMLAEHFARRGMAVLRTDARGYGASTGPNDWELYTTADRVEDNRAALAFLRKRDGIDARSIVLFGHSEGAMIAAELAAGDPGVALTVLLSPSALPGNEVFARQRADNLRRMGATEEAVVAVHEQLLRFADFLANHRDDRALFEKIAFDFLVAHGVPEEEVDPAVARGLIEGYLKAPWYWYFVAYDPREALRRIDTPVLAVFAGADENVPWRAHLPALIGAFASGASSDFTAAVLPDQDHFFLEFDGKRLERHRPGEMTVANELYDALDAELSRRIPASGLCPSSVSNDR